jgi:RNA-directed DNA polymerase
METQNSKPASTGLEQIAELARANPATVFHSIHHRIDIKLLHEAHAATRKSGAVGIDGVTAKQYAEN